MKTCRICGKELHLVPDPSCPPEWVKKILSIPMCCNRCGDFGWERSQLRDAILHICISIGVLARNDFANVEDDEKEMIRRKLASLTKRYAQAICKFIGRRYSEGASDSPWHPEIITELWDNHHHASTVLDVFEKGIRSCPAGPLKT